MLRLKLRFFLFSLSLGWIWPSEAVQRDAEAVYIARFDPVQQAQLDAARIAIQKYNLKRVLMIPDPSWDGVEDLETRLGLLRLSLEGDPRLSVPTLKDLEALAEDSGHWNKLFPDETKVYRIVDENNRPGILRDLANGPTIQVWARGDDAKGARLVVRTKVRPDQADRIHKNPVMNEILLPRPAAVALRERGLYGHDGRRGYFGLPETLTTLVDYEQRINDRAENTTVFASVKASDLPVEYHAEQRAVFPLYHVDVSRDQFQTLITGKLPVGSESLVQLENGKLRFFIHPHSAELYRPILKGRWEQKYWATPMASQRSLVVWDPNSIEPPFGLKISLDAKIGGSLRHLSLAQIQRAATSSALLGESSKAGLAKEGIVVVDEPAGIALRSTGHGYAIRQLPRPGPGAELVPLFSFYSKAPGAQAKILNAIDESGLPAKNFVDEFVIEPLVRQYHYLYWSSGLIGEPHEQNVLIELKKGRPTGRFFYRDMAGFHVDLKARQASGRGFEAIPEGVKFESLRVGRAEVLSNAVDYLLQSNFFALWIAVRDRYPEVTRHFVEERFRTHMRQALEVRLGRSLPDDFRVWKGALSSHFSSLGQKTRGCEPAVIKFLESRL
jgi:hypothetical protein